MNMYLTDLYGLIWCVHLTLFVFEYLTIIAVKDFTLMTAIEK
jgi:hypothetical protein